MLLTVPQNSSQTNIINNNTGVVCFIDIISAAQSRRADMVVWTYGRSINIVYYVINLLLTDIAKKPEWIFV